jgi:putative ABC transport system permease protein
MYTRYVDPGYFAAMRIPLKRGRLFDEHDTGRPRVAIINDVMARRHWPNQDPVGRRFGNGRDWFTVVGVVAGVRHMTLTQEPDAEYYEPYPQNPVAAMSLTLRSAGADPASFSPALRRAVQDLDKDIPVAKVGTMLRSVQNSTASRRFSVILLGVFAAVALLLAAVGIYGVISFSVSRRTHEIGIRMALGAGAGKVLRMVVGQAILLATAGVALGIAGGLALAGVIRTLLYGISPTDPATLAVVSAVLIAVAVLAAWLPARRAARVDPSEALRYE